MGQKEPRATSEGTQLLRPSCGSMERAWLGPGVGGAEQGSALGQCPPARLSLCQVGRHTRRDVKALPALTLLAFETAK